MFTIEVANELSRRGHSVCIYSSRVKKELARIVYPSKVHVKSRFEDVPWTPDIIHGQNHLQTAAALAFFSQTPAIFYIHGLGWTEQMFAHPRIINCVVMCEWMLSLVETESGVPPDRLHAIPNFVNTKRFSQVRTPPKRPSKALLFGNKGLPHKELLKLDDACSKVGLTLDKVGYAFDNAKARPETFLQEYDVVFAAGRCAFEALSCGCAVIPIVPTQAGHLVTMENLQGWIYSNFIPIYGKSSVQVSESWLREELCKYSLEETIEVSEFVRKNHNLTNGVEKIEGIYMHTIDSFKSIGPSVPNEFSEYLIRMSEEVETVLVRNKDLSDQLDAIHHSSSWRVTKPLRAIGNLLKRQGR